MFWDNYLALCINEGSTPTAVGREVCGITSATVSLWKKHRTDDPPRVPRDTILVQLANHFGVTPEWLVADHSTDGELDRLVSRNEGDASAIPDAEEPPVDAPETTPEQEPKPEQKESPAKTGGDKAGIPLIRYCQLSDDNRAAVNVMIDTLLRLQNQTGTASAANPQ